MKTPILFFSAEYEPRVEKRSELRFTLHGNAASDIVGCRKCRFH